MGQPSEKIMNRIILVKIEESILLVDEISFDEVHILTLYENHSSMDYLYPRIIE